MELIKSKEKRIMEECKRIARDNGLNFRDETLEFVITNEDMINLSPKGMIPTLYDYWLHDIFILKDKGKYDLYPHNPFETVINTIPPISFYNDNNPDWLNVMIFYHVMAHIDFFQNNMFFKRTWLDDFLGKARAQAEVIRELRYEKGRWVDYVIEFSRGIDNLVNYFQDLTIEENVEKLTPIQDKFNFFFDEYLQNIVRVNTFQYIEELNRYNEIAKSHNEEDGKTLFLMQLSERYVDFDVKYEKRGKKEKKRSSDVMEYIMDNSQMINSDENNWMKMVIQIVRDTSLYFQPQIRTKILNEGWASFWHEKLFMEDKRLRGHEFQFSKINAMVVSLPRVGMNPYAIGLRLLKFLKEKANRGMLSYEFEKIKNFEERKRYNRKLNKGLDFIFEVRKYYSDGMALNEFIDQDFVNEFGLFVTGKRLNPQKMVWEYYVKSRKAEDYKKLMLGNLYHPPNIVVDRERTEKYGWLYLVHKFEGKELVSEYIKNTMLGIEFLWGKKVILETKIVDEKKLEKLSREDFEKYMASPDEVKLEYKNVRYIMENKRLRMEVIG